MTHEDDLRDLLTSRSSARSPHELFAGVNDDFWLWANTTGYRAHPELQRWLPSMPDEQLQAKPIGNAGDTALVQGFRIYTTYRDLIVEHLGALPTVGRILEFGVGWGRLLRFFLRDADPAQLWGTDVNEHFVKICQATNRWSRFALNGTLPPMSFPDSSFNVVFSFSVFSHLGEKVHLAWLRDSARILRPGGLLIASTWHRGFIEWVDKVRRRDPSVTVHPEWRDNLATIFVDTDRWLAKYDAGDYCFEPYEASKHPRAFINGEPSHGETCIPEAYVQREWTKHMSFVDFVDDRGRCPQNVVVMRKLS